MKQIQLKFPDHGLNIPMMEGTEIDIQNSSLEDGVIVIKEQTNYDVMRVKIADLMAKIIDVAVNQHGLTVQCVNMEMNCGAQNKVNVFAKFKDEFGRVMMYGSDSWDTIEDVHSGLEVSFNLIKELLV